MAELMLAALMFIKKLGTAIPKPKWLSKAVIQTSGFIYQ